MRPVRPTQQRRTPIAALGLSSIGVGLATLLNIFFPNSSFTLMMAISGFGAMFTWLMIFVTHMFFRRAISYPSFLGAILMFAALATTAFMADFHMTLVYSRPLLLVLTAAWKLRRPA